MVELSNGSQVEIDLYKLSVAEYRAMFDTPEGETAAVVKVTGLAEEVINTWPWPDYRKVIRAIVKQAREPLADPN